MAEVALNAIEVEELVREIEGLDWRTIHMNQIQISSAKALKSCAASGCTFAPIWGRQRPWLLAATRRGFRR